MLLNFMRKQLKMVSNSQTNLPSKMAPLIRAILKVSNVMVQESKFGLIMLVTKANGRIIKPVAAANSGMLTVTFMTVNGKMIRPMDMATTPMSMEPSMKATG